MQEMKRKSGEIILSRIKGGIHNIFVKINFTDRPIRIPFPKSKMSFEMYILECFNMSIVKSKYERG